MLHFSYRKKTGVLLNIHGQLVMIKTFFIGNYLDHWKCIATLRSDGSDDQGQSAASGAFSGFSGSGGFSGAAATAGGGASGSGMAAAGTSSSMERSIPFYTGRSSFSHGLPQSSAAAPPWH